MSGLLDRLDRLERAATPGPWRLADGYGAVVSDDAAAIARCGEDNFKGYGGALVFESCERYDRDLIAEARNALPLLLAVARAAQRLHLDAALSAQRRDDPGATLPPEFERLRIALAALDAEAPE